MARRHRSGFLLSMPCCCCWQYSSHYQLLLLLYFWGFILMPKCSILHLWCWSQVKKAKLYTHVCFRVRMCHKFRFIFFISPHFFPYFSNPFRNSHFPKMFILWEIKKTLIQSPIPLSLCVVIMYKYMHAFTWEFHKNFPTKIDGMFYILTLSLSTIETELIYV